MLAAASIQGGPYETFDLTRVTWMTPFDVAVFAVLWRRSPSLGVTPTMLPPDSDIVRRYLVDMELPAQVPGDWGTVGGSVVEPPLVTLTRLELSHDWDEIVKTLWPHVRTILQDPSAAMRAMDIMSELVDNATTHGRSDTGTFVCAQRHTGAVSGLIPGIWIGIADGGIGVPEHLRNRKEYVDIREDYKLIQLARKAGVTGTRDQRGYGFYEVFESAAAAGTGERSDLLIRAGAGEGNFRLRAGSRAHARYRALDEPAPGTWIHIRLAAP